MPGVRRERGSPDAGDDPHEVPPLRAGPTGTARVARLYDRGGGCGSKHFSDETVRTAEFPRRPGEGMAPSRQTPPLSDDGLAQAGRRWPPPRPLSVRESPLRIPPDQPLRTDDPNYDDDDAKTPPQWGLHRLFQRPDLDGYGGKVAQQEVPCNSGPDRWLPGAVRWFAVLSGRAGSGVLSGTFAIGGFTVFAPIGRLVQEGLRGDDLDTDDITSH